MKTRVLNYRPMVIAFLAAAGGILAAAVSVQSYIWIPIFILLFVSCIVVALLKKYKLLLAVVCTFLAFTSFVIWWSHYLVRPLDLQDKYILGRVVSIEPERQGQEVYILEEAAIDAMSLKHRILLICNQESNFSIGDKVIVRGSIASMHNNLFDSYNARMFARGIRYEAKGKYSISANPSKLKLKEKARQYIYDKLERNLAFDTKGIAASLLFGDRSMLSSSEADNFKGGGLSHIFAVSGLHVAFFAALLFFFFKKLSLSPKATFFASLGVLFCYGAITGFPPSINRAIIMSLIVLASTLFYKRVDPLSSLCTAGLILLIAKPLNIFDISFQLSFLAVAGIATFYQGIRKGLLNTSKVGNFTASSLALSLSANSLLLPTMISAFNMIALYFCIANLVILPIVSLAFSLLLIAIAISTILPFMGILFKLASLPLLAMRGLSAFFASLPFAELKVGGMAIMTVFYFAVMLLNSKFFMLSKEQKLRYSTAVIFCAIIIKSIF